MAVVKRKYKDRREYLIDRVRKRRKLIRKTALAYKGGVCHICGYNRCPEALEFHHLGNGKDFGISKKGYTRKLSTVLKEADKCLLLCSNCHREVHAGLLQLPKETLVEKSGEFKEACSPQ